MSENTKTVQQPAKDKKSSGKEVFNRTRIIIGIIVIVVGILAVVLAMTLFVNRGQTYSILRTKAVVERGVMITKDNIGDYFAVYTTSDENLAKSGYPSSDKDVEKLFGKYIVRDLNAGEYVNKDMFSDIVIYRTGLVEGDKQLVGFHIPNMESDVGFMPQAGDIIRFYGLRGNGNFVAVVNGRLVTSAGQKAEVIELLRNVEIYSVLDANAQKVTEEKKATAVTFVLKLSETQTKSLLESQANGGVYLSLISTGNAQAKQELLAEQDKIEKRYLMLQSMVDVPEREPVTVPYSLFAEYLRETENGQEVYVPQAGDNITISYLLEVERKEVKMDGTVDTKTVTELTSPDLLALVKVHGMYRDDNLSADLALDGETAEERAEHIRNGYVSLDLAPEQLEVLTELVKSEQAYLVPVEGEPEEIDEGYLAVDAAIRLVRIDKELEAEEAAEQPAENGAEENAESATEQPAA